MSTQVISPYAYRNPTCRVCRRNRPCHGQGPAPAKLLFLGEGPGESEDWKHIPFVGPSGRELDGTLLPMAGLMRPEVYVSNAIKCRQGKKDGDDPDPEEVLACALHHLPGELARVQPEAIVTLGAHALRLFGQNHVLEMCHGRPLYNQKFAQWEGTVFPVYHPAAGLRDSGFLIQLFEDFKALRLWRHGKLEVPEDEHPQCDYRALRGLDDLWGVLPAGQGKRPMPWLEIGIDTETDDGHIWCLTFSFTPGTGYMIRADNTELLRHFREWLRAINPLVLFHNYLFDAPVLAEVGIVAARWIDTMMEAFEVATIPQALKVLAWRMCGMEMQEYEDLVLPYAMGEAIDYLHRVAGREMPELIAALPWKHKTLKCSGGKAYGGKHDSTAIEFTEPLTLECPMCGKPKLSGNMERDRGGKQFIWTRAATILNAVMEKDANPLKKWAAVAAEERAVAEAWAGRMPIPSINQVPFEEAVVYACRDADATVRVRPKIRRAAAAMGRKVRGLER